MWATREKSNMDSRGNMIISNCIDILVAIGFIAYC